MAIPYIPAQRDAATPRGDWRAHAACRDADPLLFFPAATGGSELEAAARAMRVCGGCPVRAACLDWALGARPRIGVWGGRLAGPVTDSVAGPVTRSVAG